MTIRKSVVAVGFAATCMAGTAVASQAHAVTGTVPNMYHCSRITNNCWQTNPPHVSSIINRCYWYDDVVRNAAWAPDTCDKYTAR